MVYSSSSRNVSGLTPTAVFAVNVLVLGVLQELRIVMYTATGQEAKPKERMSVVERSNSG
jgi:hypothetical protein